MAGLGPTLNQVSTPSLKGPSPAAVFSVVRGNRMFVTNLACSVYSADLDGWNPRNFLYARGNLTGIAYAEV